MKSFPKIFLTFFLIVFILQLSALLFLTLAPNASQAANEINFKPQVIQDLGYNFDSNDKTTGNIANLVRAIYKYAIGIVGILAAVVLMIGGLLWIVAGGSSAQIGEAKAWIGASLTGLLLALTSYVILATINPVLVNFQITGIQTVIKEKENIGGCCEKTKASGTCGRVNSQDECADANGWYPNATYSCINEKCALPSTNNNSIDIAGYDDCRKNFNGVCKEQCDLNSEDERGSCNYKQKCCTIKSTTLCKDLGKDYSCVAKNTCRIGNRTKVDAACPVGVSTSPGEECCRVCNDINAGCTLSGQCCSGLSCVKPAGNWVEKVCLPYSGF